MLKVLFIDDEPESVETVVEELKKKIAHVKCKVAKEFKNLKTKLYAFSPDVVVLDIFKGRAIPQGDTAGLKVYEWIWDQYFCPIVIYSARPYDIAAEIEEHPFIKLVKKGANSESRVISHIEAFRPHIEALNEVQNSVRQHVNRELKSIAPRVFKNIADTNKRRDVFVRAAKRRIAAMMDEPYGAQIVCWEQYLYPPVGSNLLTGDVIRRKNADGNSPEDYFVVLTPSCDLVKSDGRTPNVAKVLVAQCTNIANVLREEGINRSTRRDKFKDKLLPLLRRGYGRFCFPIPELPGILPPMTVELKRLKLIDLNLIGDGEGCEYCRVVSVDSPFREMIIWAYLQVTGRPGLPDRDFNGWADQIYGSVTRNNRGGEG
jgi:CTP synthase